MRRIPTLILTLALLAAMVGVTLADPSLKLVITDQGMAQVVPDLPKGTPFDWHPYSLPDGTSCYLGLTWIEGGRAKLAFYPLPLAFDGKPFPNPQPEPKPKPEPEPKPVPPTPVEEIWGLVIIEESGTITPAQGQAVTSKSVGDYVEAQGWRRSAYDKDVLNEMDKQNEAVAAYVAKSGKTLPHYFLVDVKGRVLDEGEVTTETALLNTLKKYGDK